MSKIKLLPCPLCGEDAIIEHDYDYASHPWYYIECDKCGCKTEYHVDESGKEQAIKEWNTRKPMERIMERLKEEKEKCKEYCGDKLMYENISRSHGIDKAVEIIKEGGFNDRTRGNYDYPSDSRKDMESNG